MIAKEVVSLSTRGNRKRLGEKVSETETSSYDREPAVLTSPKVNDWKSLRN